MVYLATSTEWQQKSALLLQARPTTTRITTKYSVPNLNLPRYQPSRKRKRTEADEKEDAPRTPQAVLILQTRDTASGVCLKFKTDRAAEVGRLINGLGQLGRYMAALPQKSEDVTMEDAQPAAQSKPLAEDTSKDAIPAKPQQAPGGAGKKKKKGKK